MIKRLFSTINRYPIIVTTSAWNKMEEIIIIQRSFSFLFSATSGGCNGFNYELNLLDQKKHEQIYNKNDGIIKPTIIENNDTKILIDPLAEMLLLGTKIDYIHEDYHKGIFENKFVFIPDKTLASSCGCGISFTPKS